VRGDPDLGEAVRRAALALLVLSSSISPLAAQSPVAGRLEGIVTDSLRAAPYAGAIVRATHLGSEPEVMRSAVADRAGRYRFDALDAGTYVVSVSSPLLDSLEYGGPPHRAEVIARRTTRVELGTPSRHTLQAMACPGVTLPEGKGALVGMVTSTESDRPLPGAQIAVAWTELSIDTAAQQVTSGQRAARVAVDDAGQFRMCGVPMGEWLLVQVQHEGRAGAVVRTFVGSAGVAVRNLSFSAAGSRPLAGAPDRADSSAGSLPGGDAVLAGTVLRTDGAPVPDAQVQVLGTAAAARTDAQGRFTVGRLPAGTLELEVRRLGFAVVRRAVARRLKYPDFESRRRFSIDGKFLDEDDLERRHASSLSEIVYTLPGFWVSGTGAGARVISTRTLLLGGNCEANVVIDRVPDQRINDVSPSQVAAIESYPVRGAPMQYRAPCGLIMIWTKH
jgi:hypothetical protein